MEAFVAARKEGIAKRGRPTKGTEGSAPPDKQEAATNTVLQQAELLSDLWTKAM